MVTSEWDTQIGKQLRQLDWLRGTVARLCWSRGNDRGQPVAACRVFAEHPKHSKAQDFLKMPIKGLSAQTKPEVEEDETSRVFSTDIGIRPAEPCSISVAATQPLGLVPCASLCYLVCSSAECFIL